MLERKLGGGRGSSSLCPLAALSLGQLVRLREPSQLLWKGCSSRQRSDPGNVLPWVGRGEPGVEGSAGDSAASEFQGLAG